jgi:glutathione synthase/RimK-type ligase-like ATP-grasp enzyme
MPAGVLGGRPVVLLATWAKMPDGEEWAGTRHLPEAFARRGIEARWVVWDDPGVDWSEGLVAVRSTWDYEWRREEFLDWARAVPWLLNSAAVFAWNTDKSYLPRLADTGVPVVPTVVVEGEEELPEAVAEHAPAVVKPTVGAGGRGVVVFSSADSGQAPDGGPEDLDESGLGPAPWVVQPLVESVRTEGETSVFVLDGRVVSQARKVPAQGEIRVHESYGGTTVAVPVSEEAADLARRTVEAASGLLGERLDYARVDQMRLSDGTLAVSELEVTEPGLYLEILPQNADAFADLVEARLRERSGSW